MDDHENTAEQERKSRCLAFIDTCDIRRIISVPTYRGVVRVKRPIEDRTPQRGEEAQWDEFKGRHQPIVDDDLYFRANLALQKAAKQRPGFPKGSKSAKFTGLLLGLTVCARCDSGMTVSKSSGGRKKTPHFYYRCIRNARGGTLSECTTRCVSCDALDTAVTSMIQSLEANPSSFSRLGLETSEERREKDVSALNSELLKLESEIAEQNKQIDRFLDYVRSNTASPLGHDLNEAAEKAKKIVSELEYKRIQVAARLSRLSAKTPSISDLAKKFGDISRALQIADRPRKMEIFRAIIKMVSLKRVSLVNTKGEKRRGDRVYRTEVEFRTNEIMGFGVKDLAELNAITGYRNIELSSTFEISSSHGRQTITLMEHGYRVQSGSYGVAQEAKNDGLPDARENPIQRAVRWKIMIEGGDVIPPIRAA
jgi:Recombinase zinc beta ribbon domain/Recombinase